MNATRIADAVTSVRRRLIDSGYCGDAVDHAITRVGLRRVLDGGGLGKVHQTRRVERDLYQGLAPRPVMPGERCLVLPNYPGQENAASAEISRFQNQGYVVTSVQPYKGHTVIYACPPGQVPHENQFLSREVF